MTVSLLSWYHWSDSVLMEEAKKRLRSRAEESRRKRLEGMSRSEFSASTIDEKSFEDDEDISIIEEKPLHRSLEDDSDDIEELSGLSESGELRLRKTTTKSTESQA